MRASKLDFIREQGYPIDHVDDRLYSALMLQPRIVSVLIVTGVAVQSPWLFIPLAAVLLWSALIPALNPFDAIYNAVVAGPRGFDRLSAAPAPRRFAMTMAGMVSFTIGIALLADVEIVARLIQGLFVVAVSAVVFANRCAPATVYHLLRRRLSPSSPLVPSTVPERRC